MVDSGLPTYPVPLIGREEELVQIVALLSSPACRLLTLTGPGGVGKTRLAVESAQQLQTVYEHGVHFVALQPLNTSGFIVPGIAEALDFQFYPGSDTRQQLLDFLRERALLLVLDNFEHLLGGVDIISEILASAPGVRVLTTSRERLNLREEWVLEVGALGTPANEREPDVERYSAIELFLQHARRANVRFKLVETQKPAIIRICRMVGGMPLGIELAAGWVRVLSCQAIADEIEHSLDILETSALNMEPRHRSMRAAIEPTWQRLADEERRVFGQLSVFRGSFTREAAGFVAGASLRTLTALVDKSLVRVDAHGRYDLHELLRQYAEERLDEAPDEAARTRDRHCRHYFQFLITQWPRLTGSEIKSAIQDINIELENVRAAWDWAVIQHNAEAIEAVLDSLWLFYDTDHRHQEGEQVFERAAGALQESVPQQVDLWVKVLARQGALCFFARPVKSRSLLQECLPLLRQAEARNDLAFVLYRLWFVTPNEDWGVRVAHLEESLVLYTQLGDQWDMGRVLGSLCEAHIEEGVLQGSAAMFRQALRYGHDCLALFQQFNSLYGVAQTWLDLGMAHYWLREYPQAYHYFRHSTDLFRDINIRWGVLYSLTSLGVTACTLGKNVEARRFALQALYYISDHNLPHDGLFALNTLCVIAEIWLGEGKTEKAYELLGMVEQQRQRSGYSRMNIEFHLLSRLDEALPPSLAAAVERGRIRDFDNFVKEILRELENAESAPPRLLQTSADALTERELEILGLMADGLTSREIAQQLVLSVGTIRWYVKRIYSKLDVHSRSQAIARARALNLVR